MLRALGLGDLLTAVPALRALRSTLPDHHLTLAAPAVLGPLLEPIGAVDELVPVEGLLPLPCRLVGIDLAVNLHGRGPQSTALLQGLRPRRLIAYDRDLPWRDDEHEVLRWCHLVDVVNDVTGGRAPRTDPDDLRLRVAFRDRRGGVVIHPGASSGGRRWPVERFAAVARWLTANGHHVTVTGGPDEEDLAGRLVRRAGGPSAGLSVQVGVDLSELMATVAAAELVIVGDTGVAHLATAVETPSVLLFGPTSPARWGPRSGPHTVLWKGEEGDPHATEPATGLLAITVEEVLDAAAQRLASRPPGPT